MPAVLIPNNQSGKTECNITNITYKLINSMNGQMTWWTDRQAHSYTPSFLLAWDNTNMDNTMQKSLIYFISPCHIVSLNLMFGFSHLWVLSWSLYWNISIGPFYPQGLFKPAQRLGHGLQIIFTKQWNIITHTYCFNGGLTKLPLSNPIPHKIMDMLNCPWIGTFWPWLLKWSVHSTWIRSLGVGVPHRSRHYLS